MYAYQRSSKYLEGYIRAIEPTSSFKGDYIKQEARESKHSCKKIHHLDLICMPTKYHHNISKGIRVIIQGRLLKQEARESKHSCTLYTIHAYQISKYLKEYKQIHSRETTQRGSKGDQTFLHTLHSLDQIYMPTKYHQNISDGIKVIECTSFCLWVADRQTETDARLFAISPKP